MLPELVKRSGLPKDAPLTIWTSTLRRTSQTAQYLQNELGWEKLQWKALDELDSGVCDGMTVRISPIPAASIDLRRSSLPDALANPMVHPCSTNK